jgi:chromodomain-helicase-DNA-binding protein 1
MHAIASGSGTPQLGDVRFSTRRAAKVTNYNEDDEHDFSEEDSENATPNHWVAAVEDESAAIDAVLTHKLKDTAGMRLL